ncbi:MAG: calcium-binding protein [Thermodesulfobacteriota bacterium]
MDVSSELPSPWKEWSQAAIEKVLEELGIKVEQVPSGGGADLNKPSVCVPLPPSKPAAPIVVIDCGTITIAGQEFPLRWAPNEIGPLQIEISTNLDAGLKQHIRDFEDHFNALLNEARKGKKDLTEVSNSLWDSMKRLFAYIKQYFPEWDQSQGRIVFQVDFNRVLDWVWPPQPARQGCAPDEARDIFDDAFDMLDPFSRRDPLLLDLDHDGIETISSKEGVYFDHKGDGFAELTGWVAPDDGMLAIDRNGNGQIDDDSELFGNQTLLANGTLAANGFQALAALDDNGDGKIDSGDRGFSQLRILKYSEENGELPGWCLYTLDEVGIKSISLASTPDAIVDPEGNTRTRIGSFEWTDGTTGQIAEYTLQSDTMYSIPTESLDVPDDIGTLPDLQGYGVVYDLHQAMVRDTTGELKLLVEQFVSATDTAILDFLMEQILFKWAGTDRLPLETSIPAAALALSTERESGGGVTARGMYNAGDSIDDRKVAVLEHLFGQAWVGADGSRQPDYAASILLNESFRRIFEWARAELMAQTHLKGLYDKLSYAWDEERQELKTGFTDVIPEIVAALDTDPEQGKELLSEFARSLRGISSCSPACYLTFREHMLEIDPTLGWVFDTGGLPVYDQLGQGDGWYYPHMFGTWGSDAVKGSLTAGDGVINGLSGDDVIYGTARNELIYHSDGDALIVAGGGRDTIWAGAGNDILDGGQGSDTLRGETGNDTYILRVGSGRDTIIETDKTVGNVHTVSGMRKHRTPFLHVSRTKHSIPALPANGARRSGVCAARFLSRCRVGTAGPSRGAFRRSGARLHDLEPGGAVPTQPDGRFTLGQKFLEPISLVPFLSNRGSFGRLLLHAQ